MGSKRPGVMKSTMRAASGGVIVVAALLALMFFRGTGTGDGDAETAGTPDASPGNTLVSTETTPGNSKNPVVPRDESGGLTPDEQKALSGKVLGILIDERSFLLAVPDGESEIYKPIKLQRLTELAKLADGDSNGIRVRVMRRESARMSAEAGIKQALQSVGIGDDAIYMPAEFVP
jgi:hypothetical protein